MPCEAPTDIPDEADLGNMTMAATMNGIWLRECEDRRAGAVQAYEKARQQ